jgi:hypothetical protein
MISMIRMSLEIHRPIWGYCPNSFEDFLRRAYNATNEDEVLSEIWCSIHKWKMSYLSIIGEKIVDAKKKILSS